MAFSYWVILATFGTVCYGSVIQKYIQYCEREHCTPRLCVTSGQSQLIGVPELTATEETTTKQTNDNNHYSQTDMSSLSSTKETTTPGYNDNHTNYNQTDMSTFSMTEETTTQYNSARRNNNTYNQTGSNYCCGDCFCDSECFKRGDCCPDIISPKEIMYLPSSLFMCMDTLDVSYSDRNISRMYYTVIGRCPITYNDSMVDSRCQVVSSAYGYNTSGPVDGYNTSGPVFDPESGESFLNIHCALCNSRNVSVLQHWNSTTKCETKFNNTTANGTVCNEGIRVWSPPSDPEPDACNPVYDRCNVTGMWAEYDDEIDTACRSYRIIFRKMYQNIFCFICNHNMEHEWSVGLLNTGFIFGNPPPLSVLFDFEVGDVHVENHVSHSTCPNGFIKFHSKDDCLQIICLDRFRYNNETKSCLPESILCASVMIKFKSNDDQIMNMEEVRCSLEKLLKETTAGDINWTGTIDIHLIEYRKLELTFVFQATFIYEATVVDSILDYQEKNITVGGKTLDNATIWYTFKVYIDVDSEMSYQLTAVGCSPLSFPNVDSVWKEETAELFNTCEDDKHVRVSYLVHCPVVALNLTTLNVTITANGLYIAENDMFLKPYQYIYKQNNSDLIFICVKDVINPRKEMVNIDSLQSDVDLVISYLTLVCTSISIVSSTFSFITYAVFPVLRTQPGVNNMILCMALLLGQLLFIAGIDHVELGPICVAIGVVLHLLWLFTAVWMTVCCLHMFRMFRFPLTCRNGSIIRTTVIYIIAACIISVLLVLTNVIYSLVSTGGDNPGYGSKLCWISIPSLVGYTMSLPALLAVLFNIGLFICVIFTIKKSPNVQSTVQNRQFMIIYLKLSSLTGAIWLVVIPTISTDIKAFEYIFTILFANQGLFTMLAFTCNKRTYALYRNCLTRKSKSNQYLQRSTTECSTLSNNTNDQTDIPETNTASMSNTIIPIVHDNRV